MNKSSGAVFVLLSAAMWGISGVCGQFLFENYHPDPTWLIAVRQLVAGILFLGYLVVTRQPIFTIWHSNRENLHELILFILGLLGAQYGFYLTISLSNAPTGTVLQYLAPIFVVLWEAFLRRRLPEGREIFGVLLAMTGVFLISTHGDPAHLVISPMVLCSGIISALTLAVYTVCPITILKRFSTTVIMGWGQLISAFLLLPFCHLTASGISHWDLYSAGAMFYIIFLGTLAPFTLFLIGVKAIGPTKASLLSCFEPLCSITCTVVFLDTILTRFDYAGMICIIVTVILLAMQKNK